MKTYVYIDAFNLYFGCVKGTPYKWLDLSKLCAILLPQHQIEGIKYLRPTSGRCLAVPMLLHDSKTISVHCERSVTWRSFTVIF